MIIDILLFIIGLSILVGGSELVVRSASRLAAAAGISSLVIGLTIVSVGTSAPELAVGAAGALEGRIDAGLGNVIGSNIFNILFVLGLVAFIAAPAIDRRSLRFDLPVMALAALITPLMVMDRRIGTPESLILLGLASLYVLVNVVLTKRETDQTTAMTSTDRPNARQRTWTRIAAQISIFAVGILALGLGAHWVVSGATGLARTAGMSELAIGLTLIAFGTSLPELVTSLVAIRRNEKDIAVGNIVGSCIFNLLVVLPAMALLGGGNIEVASAAVSFDVPVMVVATIACLPLALSGRRVSRAEGAALVACYCLYVIVLATEYRLPADMAFLDLTR